MVDHHLNIRPEPDPVIRDIATYVTGGLSASGEAWQTARLCVVDALGCAMAALNFPACTRLLGPVVPGTVVPDGARVPGSGSQLDPITAAFNLGAMIRWLDFNDTWLAEEWGHPSDNLGGILMVADWLSRRAIAEGLQPLTMGSVLASLIQAYEIQGVLAIENSFNRVGLDHVVLVKVATTAVVARMLGCDDGQVINAVSNAWIDGQSLRTYRHSPNTGSRKSWAAGDATSRGVRLAWMAKLGEMGYPSALSAPIWGFYDVLYKGQPFRISRHYGSYVIENILFKVSFPAEFHAQTAVEAAFQLHAEVRDRLDQVEKIVITTQEAAIRIIDKKGPLYNPADRDHCIQYMTALGLLYGTLTAEMYEDQAAADPMINYLRDKIVCVENPRYSQDYLNPAKRSIANAVQVFFRDGTQTEHVEVEYPAGHKFRRSEAIPLLEKKFIKNCTGILADSQVAKVLELLDAPQSFDDMPVHEFVNHFHPLV